MLNFYDNMTNIRLPPIFIDENTDFPKLMLKPKRIPAGPGMMDLWELELQSYTLTGIQAAHLIDQIHDCIVDGAYMDVGSVDLNDIAGRMLHECDIYKVTT